MKAYQLRVRIDQNSHDQLIRLLTSRAKNESLSDLIREAIELYVGLQTHLGENSDFSIDAEAKCMVKELAQKLDRTPGRVLEDCVAGILDLSEQNRTPLIILELELRKKYYAERASKSAFAERDSSDVKSEPAET